MLFILFTVKFVHFSHIIINGIREKTCQSTGKEHKLGQEWRGLKIYFDPFYHIWQLDIFITTKEKSEGMIEFHYFQFKKIFNLSSVSIYNHVKPLDISFLMSGYCFHTFIFFETFQVCIAKHLFIHYVGHCSSWLWQLSEEWENGVRSPLGQIFDSWIYLNNHLTWRLPQ